MSGETVIVLGLLLAFACVALAARGLDDRAPERESGALDALLFLLCLVGIVAARRARERDDEDE